MFTLCCPIRLGERGREDELLNPMHSSNASKGHIKAGLLPTILPDRYKDPALHMDFIYWILLFLSTDGTSTIWGHTVY